jgi:hypothetical protein
VPSQWTIYFPIIIQIIIKIIHFLNLSYYHWVCFCRSNDSRRPTLACNGWLFLLPHVPGVIAGQTVLATSRTHLLFDWVQQRRATNAQYRLQRQHTHSQQQQQY